MILRNVDRVREGKLETNGKGNMEGITGRFSKV